MSSEPVIDPSSAPVRVEEHITDPVQVEEHATDPVVQIGVEQVPEHDSEPIGALIGLNEVGIGDDEFAADLENILPSSDVSPVIVPPLPGSVVESSTATAAAVPVTTTTPSPELTDVD